MAEPNSTNSTSSNASDASNAAAAACLEELSFSPSSKSPTHASSKSDIVLTSTSSASTSKASTWSNDVAVLIAQKGVPFSQQDDAAHSATLQPSTSAEDTITDTGKAMVERELNVEGTTQPSAAVPSQFASSSPSLEAEPVLDSTLALPNVDEMTDEIPNPPPVALTTASTDPSSVSEPPPTVEPSAEMSAPRPSTTEVAIPGTLLADGPDVPSQPVPSDGAKPPALKPPSFLPSEDAPAVPSISDATDLNVENEMGLDLPTNGMTANACGKKVRFEPSAPEQPQQSSTALPSLLSTPAVKYGSIEDLEGRVNILEELQKLDPNNELISPETRKISAQYDELISPELSPLVSPDKPPKKRLVHNAKQRALLDQLRFEQTVKFQNLLNQGSKFQKQVEDGFQATQNTIRSEAAATNSKVDANAVKLDANSAKLDRILSHLPAESLGCSRQLTYEGAVTDSNPDAGAARFVNPAFLYEQAVALAKEGNDKDEIDHILFDRYESICGQEVERALADVAAGITVPSRPEAAQATPTPTSNLSLPSSAPSRASLIEPSPSVGTFPADDSANADVSRENCPPVANCSGGAKKAIGNENAASSSMRNGSKSIVAPSLPLSALSQSTNLLQRKITSRSLGPPSRKTQSICSDLEGIYEQLFEDDDKWQTHVGGLISLKMIMTGGEVNDKSIRYFLLVRGGKRFVLKRILELMSMNRTERRVECLAVIDIVLIKLKDAPATEAGHDAIRIIIPPLLKICGDRETSFVPELATEKLLILVDVAKHHNYYLPIHELLSDWLRLSKSMRQCEKRMGRYATALLGYFRDLELTEDGRVGLLKADDNIIKAVRACIHHKAASVREIGAEIFCSMDAHSDLCHLAERLYKNIKDGDIKKRLRSAKLNVGK